GEAGRAGSVRLPGRRDALCAAAEIVLAVEEAAHATGRADTVATTGVCRVHPDAINSIPARVTLEIDVRDTDLAARDGAVGRIRETVARGAGRRAAPAGARGRWGRWRWTAATRGCAWAGSWGTGSSPPAGNCPWRASR